MTTYGETLQKIMATGRNDMRENNQETIAKLSEIETFLQEKMNAIESQTTLAMISAARKNIALNHWLEALKYGGVAAVLVSGVIYALKFLFLL